MICSSTQKEQAAELGKAPRIPPCDPRAIRARMGCCHTVQIVIGVAAKKSNADKHPYLQLGESSGPHHQAQETSLSKAGSVSNPAGNELHVQPFVRWGAQPSHKISRKQTLHKSWAGIFFSL